jgi:twinkle protein
MRCDKMTSIRRMKMHPVMAARATLITHGPCPSNVCDSTDAYSTYEDGHGWCFSCQRGFYPKNYKKGPQDFTLATGTNYRGIPQSVCDLYGIKTYADDEGTVLYRTYEGPDYTKERRCGDKNFNKVGKGKPEGLGGTWLFNAGCSHYITVVEGEEDAAAAYHMLNNGRKTLHPVVWLNSASISPKHRDGIYKYLSSFETVKLAIEDDKPGIHAKNLLSEMLPNKIREVQLTKHKDANDYLTHGDEAEFKAAWANAGIFTPDNIFHTEGDITAILADTTTEQYIETPFNDLNEKIRGLLTNHVTLITGMEGLGKTEVLRAFEYEMARAGKTIAIIHFEETKAKTIRALACYELEENVRELTEDADLIRISEAWRLISDNYSKVYLFEFKNDPDVNTILEQVNYLVKVLGIDYLFVDPINQFDPVDDTSKVEFLDSLAKRVEKYCSQNNVGVVWTAHVDDEGRTRNSRMIAKACSIRIDLQRDHMNEDLEERNKLHFFVSKNRPFGETGYAGFSTFDHDSYTIGTPKGVEDTVTLGPPSTVVVDDDGSVGF